MTHRKLHPKCNPAYNGPPATDSMYKMIFHHQQPMRLTCLLPVAPRFIEVDPGVMTKLFLDHY